ncbi:MAG: hypothetical protein II938_00850 [Alphaproteobacteria bacterium]|nr:hypothetical protein [Alphaproteobacteria bacterium]
MKKGLALALFFLLGACRVDDAVFIDVERSTIYHGQTVASLYDNFGVPTSQYVDKWGIREYHYDNQSFLRRGVNNYVYYCDFIVYTDEGIVIDWKFRGNRCPVEATEKEFYLE